MLVPVAPGPEGDAPRDFADTLNAQARAAGWQVRCDTALAFDDSRLSAMRDIWLAHSAAGLPSRASFSMRELKLVLSNLAILEIQDDAGQRHYRYRFVGTAVVERFGEITGRAIDEFVPPALLPKTLAYFDAVAVHAKALRVVTKFELSPVDFLESEALLLPLSDDGVTPNKMMTVSYFKLRSADWGHGAAITPAKFLPSLP